MPTAKNTQEIRVQSLGQKDPLEKEVATHSVFLPGKSHGQRSLAGYSPWGHKELDTTEQLNMKLPEISLASLMTPLLQTPVTSTNLSHVIKD